MPCVVFRSLVFKAGTTVYAPRTRAELMTLASVLKEVPGHRLEIGSRLGPGRPMASDQQLRAERARLVRDSLIALGVMPERLVLEQADTFERVDDVGRKQSIGLCVHS